MAEIWIPEFQDLAAVGSSNEMYRDSDSVKATWHTTEAPSGFTKSGNSYFDAMHRVLRDNKSEPHILIDPVTDEAGQYFALNRSARALRSVNRSGKINIQIEVVAYAGKPFTRTWKPGPNWRALMRALRSWGIPDVFPGGPLMRAYGDSRTSRSTGNWKKSGHFGHCQAPSNTHWDPGDIDVKALFALGGSHPIGKPVTANEEDELDARQAQMLENIHTTLGAGGALWGLVESAAQNGAQTRFELLGPDDGGWARMDGSQTKNTLVDYLRNIQAQTAKSGSATVALPEAALNTIAEKVAAKVALVVPAITADEVASHLEVTSKGK